MKPNSHANNNRQLWMCIVKSIIYLLITDYSVGANVQVRLVRVDQQVHVDHLEAMEQLDGQVLGGLRD